MIVRVPLSAVQAAIYSKIKTAHPTYTIFAYSPTDNPAFPYIVMGQLRGTQDDTKSSNGWVVTYTLDAYSQSTGTAELDGILNGILGSLTDTALLVDDDWDVIEYGYTWSAATEPGDEKGPLQHGTVELTIRLEDSS